MNRHHFAEPKETAIEALERAYRLGMFVAAHANGIVGRVNIDQALALLRGATPVQFFVEVPL